MSLSTSFSLDIRERCCQRKLKTLWSNAFFEIRYYGRHIILVGGCGQNLRHGEANSGSSTSTKAEVSRWISAATQIIVISLVCDESSLYNVLFYFVYQFNIVLYYIVAALLYFLLRYGHSIQQRKKWFWKKRASEPL